MSNELHTDSRGGQVHPSNNLTTALKKDHHMRLLSAKVVKEEFVDEGVSKDHSHFCDRNLRKLRLQAFAANALTMDLANSFSTTIMD